MKRSWSWCGTALGVLAVLAGTAGAQAPPTRRQTMDYLVKKVAAEPGLRLVQASLLGDRSRSTTRTVIAFETNPSPADAPDTGDRIVIRRVVIQRAEDADEDADGYCWVTAWVCPLKQLDPDRVVVSPARAEDVAATADGKPYFNLLLTATADARAFQRTDITGGLKNVRDLLGEDLFTTWIPRPWSGEPDAAVSLTFAEEPAARAAAKALAHLIRECGGKPSPPADPTAAFFEGDDASPTPAATPAPASTPAPTPAPAPQPVAGGPSRADQRRRIEKEILDAEAALPAALRQDAANKRWNDQWEATIRRRIQDIEAKARAARENDETIKSLALEAATLPLMAELDRGELRRDTGAAERIRQRITELKKQLIDLGD